MNNFVGEPIAYRGKLIDEMTVEELRAALKDLAKLYRNYLRQSLDGIPFQ